MLAEQASELLRINSSLLREFSVVAVFLFGSSVRGEDRIDSDIDLIVEFDTHATVGLFEFVRLRDQLSMVFGNPVDLVTPDAIHPALKQRIMQEAVRVA
jgi:predicted nucleotidyltransferase